jgi:glycosyltransferase involved in cell wall biosynthesis
MTRTRVTLLTLGDPDRVTGGYLFHRRLADRAPQHGAEIEFVSIPDLPLPWAMLTGAGWLRSRAVQRADVLVLDSIAAAPAAPWLGRIRVPVVGMLHQPIGGMDAGPWLRSFQAPFDRAAYRRCDVLMVASDWLATQLADAGIERERLWVVPPGKDLDIAPRDEQPAVRTAGAADVPVGGGDTPWDTATLRTGRRIAAVCVANWLPRKGILELLDAVASLPADALTLHLVGDAEARGPYVGRVRRRLAQPDLRGRVVVHGLIPPAEVEELYRTADVFVLPSFEEPYGTVWGEAMAAGLPVVGWRAGNLPFLADHDKEGLLAPIGDVGALADGLRRLAHDPELRARMGRAAAVRAEARPTWDQTADRFFAVIAEVLAAHRGADEPPHRAS